MNCAVCDVRIDAMPITPEVPPLTSPSWLTPERLAVAVIALGAGVAAVPAVARIDVHLARSAAPALIACSGALSAQLARSVLRERTVRSVVLNSMGKGALFGALNSGLVLFLVMLGEGNGPKALLGFLAGMLIGGFVGGPLGFLFGVAFSPVLSAAIIARTDRSHDALESVLLMSGIFLPFVGLFTGWDLAGSYRHAGLALSLAGIACTSIALARDLARLGWSRLVRAGRLTRYEIVSTASDVGTAGLLPLFRTRGNLADGVLVRIDGDANGAPFRTVVNRTPLARMHLRAEDEHPHARRRVSFALLVAAVSIACAAAPWFHRPTPSWLENRSALWGSWD